MKHLFILATAAFALASCSNNETVENDVPVELRLSSGIEVQGRAAANTQGEVINKDEVVSVWVDDAGSGSTMASSLYAAYQLTADGGNGFTGDDATMYFPQSGNKVDIYAVHGGFTAPFSKGDVFPTAAVEYKVPGEQVSTFPADGTYTAPSNYAQSDLLYAYSKGVARGTNPTTVNLTFYHMLSKLELAIVQGVGTPELAESKAVTLGNDDIVLNGTFTPSASATMSDQSARQGMLGDATSQTKGTMTLGQVACSNFEEDNIIYNEAILVPQDMSGRVFTFKLKSGGTLQYAIPGSTTFESGKKYQYKVTMKLTGLTVTSSIEPWGNGITKEGDAEMQ